MGNSPKNIFVICGESSGNKHAYSLIKSYNDNFGDVSFTAIGDDNLISLGTKLLFNYSDINFIGFTSIAKNYFSLKAKFNTAVKYVKDNNPAAVVLIDSPGFNLRFMKSIRSFYKGKIIYYISPQLWAWHKSRVKYFQKYCDSLLVVFPFEVDFYKAEDVHAEFVGHPLMKRINNFLSQNKIKSFEQRFVTLLPGSRKEEVENIFPTLYKAGRILSDEFNLQLQLIHPADFDISVYGDCAGLTFVENNNDEILYNAISSSRLAVTKMGTASMECALLEIPFITGYKTNSINYFIGKSLAHVKYLTMANILLDREVVKEFIQNDFTSDNIVKEGRRILTDESYRQAIVNGLKEVKEILTDKDASYNVAKILHESIK